MNDDRRGLLIACGGGLVVNFVSSVLGTSPIVFFIAIGLGLVLFVATRRVAASSEKPNGMVDNLGRALKFFVAMFLVGAVLGGISVIPLFPLQTFRLSIPSADPRSPVLGLNGHLAPFYGYEVSAVGLVVLLAAVALARGQSLTRTLSFVVSAAAGATFAYISLRPQDHGDLIVSFVGWSIAAIAVVLFLYLLPELGKTLKAFWFPSRRQTGPRSGRKAPNPAQAAPVQSDPQSDMSLD